jgi:aspartate aminotransferase
VATSISARALQFPENPIRGLGILAAQAQTKGTTVIPLNIGAPDTSTAITIRKAGAQFLQKSKSIAYGPSVGDTELISNIKNFYTQKLQLKNIRPNNILITQGASEALELLFYTIADQNDEILTPDPFYPNYNAIAYKYAIKLKPIPTNIDNGFHLINQKETIKQAVARLSKLVTKKTKAIIWSSPGNPTGTVFSTKELKVLFLLAKKHDLFLISDEVYRLLTFEKSSALGKILRSPSILDIVPPSQREKIIVLDSASKMISFCGARVGTIVASDILIQAMAINASVRGCPSTISQAAMAKINEIPTSYFNQNRKELEKRRDFLYQELVKLKEIGITVSPQKPEGAFYIVAGLGKKVVAQEFCKWLLTDYPQLSKSSVTLMLTPMRMGKGGFYLNEKSGFNQVRIAYVVNMPSLKKAIDILKDSLLLYLSIKK